MDKTADIIKSLVKFTLICKFGYYIRFHQLVVEYVTVKKIWMDNAVNLEKGLVLSTLVYRVDFTSVSTEVPTFCKGGNHIIFCSLGNEQNQH